MSATWITGDTLEVLRAMPSASVDLVMTSPPFLALRSYLPDDDPAKVQEIGQESTPGEFLDVLLDITEELRRVLAPHGSICVELGDTYAGSGGAGGDYADGGLRDGQPKFRAGTPRWDGRPDGQVRTTTSDPAEIMAVRKVGGEGWPESKSLCLIPELYRFALAYGFNPLTGRQTPRWRIRNVIRWVRPNPPVGALGDKFRPGTSEMVIATGCDEAGRRRYFDLDAVRATERNPNTHARTAKGVDMRPSTGKSADNERRGGNWSTLATEHLSEKGAPPLDWWEIPTAPYKGSHYATYPPALVERPVKAMCPLRVCTTCGEPSRRIVEHERGVDATATPHGKSGGALHSGGPMTTKFEVTRETLGWTDCGHDTWRPGIVLDPFGGSGTTLAVATGHGRDAIGIDLDARNADLARERVGPMFFHEATVDELWPGAA